MTNRDLPSLRDVVGPLAELPLDVRARLADNHFGGPKDKHTISCRTDDKMLEALDQFLLDIKFRGGISWLKSQSDVIRAGLWLLLDVYGYYYTDQLDQKLRSIITSERLRGSMETRDRIRQNLETTINRMSAQCSALSHDVHGDVELEALLDGFVREMAEFDGYWRTKYVEAALNDRHVSAALKRFELDKELEDL